MGSIEGGVDNNDVDNKARNIPLAKELSDETIFPRDSDSMYYCVREGFSFTAGEAEGFCKHISVQS